MMICWTSLRQEQILPNTDPSPLESDLDHIYKSKFALLFDWQNTDEGLVKYTSFRQLGYDLRGLGAAWRWNVDLFGEFDMTILKGKEGIVGPHSDLQEVKHDENIDCITPINVRLSQCDLHVLLGGISTTFVSQGCSQHGQSYLFLANEKTDRVVIMNSGKMQHKIMQHLNFFNS